jgi:hypothetical protein
MDPNTDALIEVQAVAAEVFGTLDTGRQIEPFPRGFPLSISMMRTA